MPKAKTDDGINLHFEETESGTRIVFVHEFTGDHTSREPHTRLRSKNQASSIGSL